MAITALSSVTSVPPMAATTSVVFDALGITSNRSSSTHQTMMSSTTNPSSSRRCVYWARPGWIRVRSLLNECCRCSKASAPRTRTVPRWLTSKATAEVRQARCSATVPDGYANGISQPPNGTILAPSSRCDAYSGETRNGAAVAVAVHPTRLGRSGEQSV